MPEQRLRIPANQILLKNVLCMALNTDASYVSSLDVLGAGFMKRDPRVFSGSKYASLGSRSGVDAALFESFSRRNNGLFSGGHLE